MISSSLLSSGTLSVFFVHPTKHFKKTIESVIQMLGQLTWYKMYKTFDTGYDKTIREQHFCETFKLTSVLPFCHCYYTSPQFIRFCFCVFCLLIFPVCVITLLYISVEQERMRLQKVSLCSMFFFMYFKHRATLWKLFLVLLPMITRSMTRGSEINVPPLRFFSPGRWVKTKRDCLAKCFCLIRTHPMMLSRSLS